VPHASPIVDLKPDVPQVPLEKESVATNAITTEKHNTNSIAPEAVAAAKTTATNSTTPGASAKIEPPGIPGEQVPPSSVPSSPMQTPAITNAKAAETKQIEISTTAARITNSQRAAVKSETGRVQPGRRSSFFNIWTLVILLLVVVVETLLLARFLFMKRRDAAIPQGSSTTAGVKPPARDSHGDMSGELEKFPITTIVQVFNSSKESGTLTIAGTTGIDGRLVFQNGEIIDADNAFHFGLEAAKEILARKKGHFRYRSEDTSMRVRHIEVATIPLLLEVAQSTDEGTDAPQDS
jgi:hypothetical protein